VTGIGVKKYMVLKFLDRNGVYLDEVVEMGSLARDLIFEEGGDDARELKYLIKIGDVVIRSE
jgi:hypothetical protein